MKKLERSRESVVVGGVCGGLGEYFNIDPVMFRIAAIVLALAKGAGVIAYVLAWILIPRRPEGAVADVAPPGSEIVRYLPGMALIVIGLVFLLEGIFDWFSFWHLWPLILIAIGSIMVVSSMAVRKGEGDGDRGED